MNKYTFPLFLIRLFCAIGVLWFGGWIIFVESQLWQYMTNQHFRNILCLLMLIVALTLTEVERR